MSVATLETLKQYFCLANRHKKHLMPSQKNLYFLFVGHIGSIGFYLATKVHNVANSQIVIDT